MAGSRFDQFTKTRVTRPGQWAGMIPRLIRHALIATLLFGLTIAPAVAIIGGEFDGNQHPYVGVAIGPGFDLCSGTAISPTIFVTAAHCFENTPGQRVAVSFDADLFGDQDGDPDPHFVFGTFHPDPEFCLGCGPAPGAFPGFLAHDSGVVVLDKRVRLERYAHLPSVGQVETLAAARTRVDIVGYGITTGQREYDPSTDTIPRMAAEAELNPGDATLGEDWVKLSANPGEDKGSICFDDSGGPALLGDTILATNSMVLNDDCIGLSYSYRLDTAAALAFIGQFSNTRSDQGSAKSADDALAFLEPFLDAQADQASAESGDRRGPAKQETATGGKHEGAKDGKHQAGKKGGKNDGRKHGGKSDHGKHAKRGR